MAITARYQGKRAVVAEIFKIGVWDVRGLCNKEFELGDELKAREINIAVISETKELKGSKEMANYVFIVK